MASKDELASLLERIAQALETNPSPIIGMMVTASSDGRRGSATGLKVSVVGGSGSGNVTGVHVSVASGQRNTADEALVRELREAAAAVRTGTAPKGWVTGILARAKDLGNRAIDTLLNAAIAAAGTFFSAG